MSHSRIFHLLLIAVCGASGLILGNSHAATPTPREAIPLRISPESVKPHIEHLAGPELRGRAGGGAEAAAEYIRRHFQEIQLSPLFGDRFLQEIPGPKQDGKPTVLGRNVGAILPGSDPKLRDEIVIVSAHFDHLGVRNEELFAGADDNASGVAMLLEVSRQLVEADIRPRRSVAFVGFDLEEHMLWGSRWFAAHAPWPLEQIQLFITADMIGRSLGNLPLPTVFVLGSEHAEEVKDTLDRVASPNGLEIARLGIDLVGTRSDYGPFRDRKVPFLFFSTGEHPDYHTSRDVPERIDYTKVAQVSTLIHDIVRDVSDSDVRTKWIDEAEPNLDEARAVHRITQLLTEQEERPLTDLQKLLVTHVQAKTGQILERGEMSASERAWLTRYAQLLLLSVF